MFVSILYIDIKSRTNLFQYATHWNFGKYGYGGNI